MMAIDNCCRKYRCTWLTTAKRYHHPHCGFSSKKVQIFSLCVSSNTSNLSLLIKIFGIQSNSFRYSCLIFSVMWWNISSYSTLYFSTAKTTETSILLFLLIRIFFYSARKIPNQHQIFLFFKYKTLRFIGDS